VSSGGRGERTGALASIVPKLAKLIRRLATNHDGEVVATARAIGRTLQSAGLSWHDLAAAVAEPGTSGPASAAPPPSWSHPAPDPDVPRSDLACVDWLLGAPAALRPNEREFLHSIRGRLAGGRALTLRQDEWLTAIYGRAGREAAR
jgi:hypothetical protein